MAGLLKLIDTASDAARGAGRGKRISQRYPTAKSATENPLTDDLVINEKAMRGSPKSYEANAKLMSDYNTVRTESKTPEGQARAAMDAATENLLWLYENTPKEIRDVSRKWYVGANSIANTLAKKHNVSVETASGVLASLSPQKDWYQNVSLAERVLSIYKNSSGKKLGKEARETASQIYGDPKFKKDLDVVFSKPFDELSDTQKAMYIRSTDQATNDRSYDIISPTGERMGKALTKSGELGTTAWGSNREIGKAINVIENPSIENISKQMGDQHKVRNFYNNIADPYHAEFEPFVGDVTIDTHAVAADQFKPLGGSALPVAQNFGGGGSASSAITGAQGTYGLHADATRMAAKEAGIMPREMQSITWEAVRSLFPASFKTTNNVANINAVWDLFKTGKISSKDARELIVEKAGGMGTPDWATGRPNNGKNVAGGSSALGGGLLGSDLFAAENNGSINSGRGGLAPDIPAEWLGRGRSDSVSQPDVADPEANLFQQDQGQNVSPSQFARGTMDAGAALLRGATSAAMSAPNAIVGLGGGLYGMANEEGGLLERFGKGAERAQSAVKNVPILGQSEEDFLGLLPRLTSISGKSKDEMEKMQRFGSYFSPF